jgi:hypothetical protein
MSVAIRIRECAVIAASAHRHGNDNLKSVLNECDYAKDMECIQMVEDRWVV